MKTAGFLLTMISCLAPGPGIGFAGRSSEASGPPPAESRGKTESGRSSEMGRESRMAARFDGRTKSDVKIPLHALPTTRSLRTKRPVNGIYSNIPSGSVMNTPRSGPGKPPRVVNEKELTNKIEAGVPARTPGTSQPRGSSLRTTRSAAAVFGGPAHSSRNTTALNGRTVGRQH